MTFYSDTNLITPVTSRIDSAIDFDWGIDNSPAPGVAGNCWSASWSGFIQVPETGYYTFYTTTDDAARLWVNDKLLIDAWYPQSPTTHTGSIYLTAGQQYSLRMDYNQFGGGEMAKLEWSSANMAREVIPAGQLTHATQAPIVYLPTAPWVTDDSSLVFSVGNGNAISVLDVDAQTSLLQVTLSTANGTFTLGNNHGLGFSSGDGQNDSVVTFTGSIDDVNAALNGLIFTPTAGYHGSATLTIDTTDLTTALSVNAHLTVTVVPADQLAGQYRAGCTKRQRASNAHFSAANGNAISIGDPDIDVNTSSVAVSDSSFETPSLGTGATAYQYAVYGSALDFHRHQRYRGEWQRLRQRRRADRHSSGLPAKWRSHLTDDHFRRNRQLQYQLRSRLSSQLLGEPIRFRSRSTA